MVDVVIVVREPGDLSPDHSLSFSLPEVPAVGSYISINNPDLADPRGEDLVVRKVWWRLFHPVTAAFADDTEAERSGRVIEIFVECDVAIGPYASDSWRRSYEGRQGVEIFEVGRMFPTGLPDDEGE